MGGKRFTYDDVEYIFDDLERHYSKEAIVRRHGYSEKSVTNYTTFFNKLKKGEVVSAEQMIERHIINPVARKWAKDNGLLPERGTSVQPNISEAPEPEKKPDFTAKGLDAIWQELNALNERVDALTKTLDTMTNSLVIELGAVSKAVEKLAEQLNGLEAVGFFGNEAGKIELTHQWDDELDFRVKKDDDSPKKSDVLWIKNTLRHFLECNGFEAYKRTDGLFGFNCPFKAAWAIDDDSIAEIAKEYGIKIRVNGFERGMEFEQTVEADESGNIVLSEVTEYDDYEWECPMPGMGG